MILPGLPSSSCCTDWQEHSNVNVLVVDANVASTIRWVSCIRLQVEGAKEHETSRNKDVVVRPHVHVNTFDGRCGLSTHSTTQTPHGQSKTEKLENHMCIIDLEQFHRLHGKMTSTSRASVFCCAASTARALITKIVLAARPPRKVRYKSATATVRKSLVGKCWGGEDCA